MKDFFGDLGKRLGETAETVTTRANEAIEIQKLKGQIRELSRGNAVDLMELGRSVYDRYKNGEELDDTSKRLCDAIKNREGNIEEYEKKISLLKGAGECPKCGKMVAKDMAFCPYCGESVVKVEEDIFEDESIDVEVTSDDAEEAEAPAEADAVTETEEAKAVETPVEEETPVVKTEDEKAPEETVAESAETSEA